MKALLSTHFDAVAIINEEAERCVKCALCAPVCPTYQLTHNESESPRGRIAIAQALAQEKILLTPAARLHLEHCLHCGACEAVCPAEVKYSALIDNTQILLRSKKPTQPQPFHWLSIKHYANWLRYGLRFYQRSGLRALLRRWQFFANPHWQRYDAHLPTLPQATRWHIFYPAVGQELGQVGLFLGCTGKLLDQNTLLATIQVLTQVGYSVHVPKQQVCCGALDLQSGRLANYQNYAQGNQRAFANLPLKAIISIANACTTVLNAYKTATLIAPVRDINEFLLNEAWNSNVIVRPYPHVVMLHTPCTLKNVLKLATAPQRLLARIPQLKLQLVVESGGCCGGVGNYFLRFPDFANALLEKTLHAIPLQHKPLILTSNLGCQLQLNKGFKRRKSPQLAIHPLVLLAQQLSFKKAGVT